MMMTQGVAETDGEGVMWPVDMKMSERWSKKKEEVGGPEQSPGKTIPFTVKTI